MRLRGDEGDAGVQPNGIPSLLEPYIQIVKLHDILAELLDGDGAHPEAVQDRPSILQSVLRFDNMIIEWRDALPLCLHYEHRENEDSPAELHTENPTTAGVPTFSKQAKTIYLRYAESFWDRVCV